MRDDRTASIGVTARSATPTDPLAIIASTVHGAVLAVSLLGSGVGRPQQFASESSEVRTFTARRSPPNGSGGASASTAPDWDATSRESSSTHAPLDSAVVLAAALERSVQSRIVIDRATEAGASPAPDWDATSHDSSSTHASLDSGGFPSAVLEQEPETKIANWVVDRMIEVGFDNWVYPHESMSPWDERVFEWWRENRKLTIYLHRDRLDAQFVKSWGPDINNDMADGVLRPREFTALWSWLQTG